MVQKREIPLFKVFMSDEVSDPLGEVLQSGYIGQGPKVDEFEKALSDYLGNPFVNTVNSGTSALHLALHMLKSNFTKERNVILSTPLTCTATNFAIVANGLKIRWVDLDPKTCNVDLTDMRRKLTSDVAGIVVVHWGGYPVDLDELYNVQRSYNEHYTGVTPWVIEDCAHAFGASYKGKRIGSHGNFCAFSFQAIKHLTTGDGGALVSPWDHMWRKAKLLRWYGLDRTSSANFRCEQNIHEWGYKFHMNDIDATIGLANFKEAKSNVVKHQANGWDLHQGLSGLTGVTLLERKADRLSADWVFTIRVQRRKDFMKYMKECGIAVSQVHDRNDKHLCLKEFKSPLPNTDLVCSDMVCIPCGWWLSKEDKEYIIDCISKGW